MIGVISASSRYNRFYNNQYWKISNITLNNDKKIPVLGTGLHNLPIHYSDVEFKIRINGLFFNDSGTKCIVTGIRDNGNTQQGNNNQYINFIQYNLTTPWDINTITYNNHEEIAIPYIYDDTPLVAQCTISKDNKNIYLNVREWAGAPYLANIVKSKVIKYELPNECTLPVSNVSSSNELIYTKTSSSTRHMETMHTSKFSNNIYIGNANESNSNKIYKYKNSGDYFDYINNQNSFTSITPSVNSYQNGELYGTIGNNDEYLIFQDGKVFNQYRFLNNSITKIDDVTLSYYVNDGYNGNYFMGSFTLGNSNRIDRLYFISNKQEYGYNGYITDYFVFHEYNTNF